MDDKLREHIKKNTEKLIALTPYEKLMSSCIREGILTNTMRQNIENSSHSLKNYDKVELQHERHKNLFLKLTKRGPTAYSKLIQILVNLECTNAVNVLYEPRDDNYHSININMKRERPPTLTRQEAIVDREDVYHEQEKKMLHRDDETSALQLYTTRPEQKFVVKKSKIVYIDPKIPNYSMKSKNNRGVFFMANIIEFSNVEKRRNGAESDGASLLHLFKELGFTLFQTKNNLTYEQFFKELDCILNSDVTRDAECFVLALMSHGSSEDTTEYVEFSDGANVRVHTIEERFSNSKCPNLIDKPKILVFPFCRGSEPDYGTKVKSKVETDGYASKPEKSHMIVCHACSLGYESHRDPDTGSWYIQTFCEMMSTYAWNTDFEMIIKKVQLKLSTLRAENDAMQTGNYTNIGFNKLLYFNPGCWESE